MHRRTTLTLNDLAREVNTALRGWLTYFTVFYPSMVIPLGAGRLRGAHVVADGAGEVISSAVYAIRARMTVDDLAGTWAPYLTMSEGLRLAARRPLPPAGRPP